MKIIRFGGDVAFESAQTSSVCIANGSAVPNFNKSRRVGSFINACLSFEDSGNGKKRCIALSLPCFAGIATG